MAEKGEGTEAKGMSEGRGETRSDIVNPNDHHEERKKNRSSQSHSHGQRRYYYRHYYPRYGVDVKQDQESISNDHYYHHGVHQGRDGGRRNRGRRSNRSRNETETKTEETGGSMEGKRRDERDHDERKGTGTDKIEVGRRNQRNPGRRVHETGEEGRREEKGRGWRRRRGEERSERQREHQTGQRTDLDSNESSCIDISVKDRTKTDKEASDECKETNEDKNREYETRKVPVTSTDDKEIVRRRKGTDEEVRVVVQHIIHTTRNKGNRRHDVDKDEEHDRSKSSTSRYSRDKEQRKCTRDSYGYHRRWHNNDRESTFSSRQNIKMDEATVETLTMDFKMADIDDLKMAATGNPRMPKKDVSSTQSHELSQQLLGGVYDCSVCCDRLRYNQEVWSCGTCYNIFHLRCVRRWAHSSAAAASEGK